MGLMDIFKKGKKKPKCAICGKETEKPVFEKGKFFCSKTHLNQYKKEKASGKSDKEICDFC